MIVEIDIGIIHNFSSCNTFPVEIYHVILVRAGWECLQIIEANIPQESTKAQISRCTLSTLALKHVQHGEPQLHNSSIWTWDHVKNWGGESTLPERISQTLPQFITFPLDFFLGGKKLTVS